MFLTFQLFSLSAMMRFSVSHIQVIFFSTDRNPHLTFLVSVCIAELREGVEKLCGRVGWANWVNGVGEHILLNIVGENWLAGLG